ncbi:hypothetical protein F3K20_31175 [Streptomyces scabiei]|nr:hypothetical protein [Streptomyces sp. LBUM 1484]MBP5869999.1 hypothetical protein [Streptomyces sp. LBUM 1485]MBP5878538.1 hypothetical protein [Streptomyces sp. LBUM 1477]MBP5886381.1 hypothetical protein [Streptomyces sp. LBUM 1487]MBP5902365.1 hypothetical protein [Streptomyces sp. LBUM 1488]MBP5914009.1 hypothetical protein [Streptomyces sp. LBUM 1486]QTU48677.1 hypothetical protein F3K20_31175 [Streptomyces sp. LBUM 1482]QTU56501.1 hypothetical protein F3K21_30010 [Streptomyces sp. 
MWPSWRTVCSPNSARTRSWWRPRARTRRCGGGGTGRGSPEGPRAPRQHAEHPCAEGRVGHPENAVWFCAAHAPLAERLKECTAAEAPEHLARHTANSPYSEHDQPGNGRFPANFLTRS